MIKLSELLNRNITEDVNVFYATKSIAEGISNDMKFVESEVGVTSILHDAPVKRWEIVVKEDNTYECCKGFDTYILVYFYDYAIEKLQREIEMYEGTNRAYELVPISYFE